MGIVSAPFLALVLGLAPGEHLAVVDVQRTMESSKHWTDAVAHLEKQRAARQTALETKQVDLKRRKEQIEAQKAVSDPSALAPKEEELFRDAQLLTQEFMQNQQELAALEKQVTEQMLSRIEAVVREVALQGDYAFVFEAGPKESPNVLYADAKTDLTPRVIDLYRERFKDKPLELKGKGQ